MFYRTTTFDNLLKDFFSEPTTFSSTRTNTSSYRAYSTSDELIYQIEAPGFNKNNLVVDFEDSTITIKGEREIKGITEKVDTVKLNKSIALETDGLELSKMKGEIVDGILTINIPFEKVKEKKKSKISLI